MSLWCYDVESVPNFFSICFVDLVAYFEIMNVVNAKGKPECLTDVLSVAEIKARLSKVPKKQFYITNEDISQLDTLYEFIDSFNEPEEVVVKNVKGENVRVRRTRRTDLYGYNSKEYDDLMMAQLLIIREADPRRTQNVCELLLATTRHIQDYTKARKAERYYKDDFIDSLKYYQLPYVSIDIMKVFALDKSFKSLKQMSINIKWYLVLEYEPPAIDAKRAARYGKYISTDEDSLRHLNNSVDRWDRWTEEEDIPLMLAYNPNDTYIVAEAARMNKEEIRTRYRVSKEFGKDLHSTSRSTMSDTIILETYAKFSGLNPHRFKNLRTERNGIDLKDVIFDYVRFQTPYMQGILNSLKETTIFKTSKEEINENVVIGKHTYVLASGGLHSVDTPTMYVATDKEYFRHWDGKSYYPSIDIQNRIAPAHLDVNAFVRTFDHFRIRRIEFKDAGDVENADIYKIAINAVTGKLNDLKNKHNWLLDSLAYLRITINGQLLILMLVEALDLIGIETVSANTDGIVVRLNDANLPAFERIISEWIALTGIKADTESWSRYISRDVNNYIAVEDNGHVTAKGAYNPLQHLTELKKGYNAPIVAQAVHDYFVKDIDPIKTLRMATHVLDFCKTQNIGTAYCLVVPTTINGISYDIPVQRNTRYYVSHHGKSLLKVKAGSRANLVAGYKTTILNDLDDTPIEDRDINYDYYYTEAMKLITPVMVAEKPKHKTKYNKLHGMFNNLFDNDDFSGC